MRDSDWDIGGRLPIIAWSLDMGRLLPDDASCIVVNFHDTTCIRFTSQQKCKEFPI